MEENLNIFENGRQPQFCSQTEDDLNFARGNRVTKKHQTMYEVSM
jgi:hypothetical protein